MWNVNSYSAFFLDAMRKSIKTAVLHVGKYMDGKDRLCKHDCLFCMERMEPQQSSEILPSIQDIEAVLKRFFVNNIVFSQIYIAGGEPTLRDDFPELIDLVRRYCPEIILSSACDYENADKVIREILDLKIGRIATSIHGYIGKTHDSLTRSPGSFERTLNNIRVFLNAGVSVTVNSVINAINVNEMPQIAKMFTQAQIPIEKLTFTHYMRRGNAYYHDELWFDIDKYACVISSTVDIIGQVGHEVTFRNFPLCLDSRLVDYREVLDDIYIISLDAESTGLSEEKAPSFTKEKCAQCLLFRSCDGYLLSNYGEI